MPCHAMLCQGSLGLWGDGAASPANHGALLRGPTDLDIGRPTDVERDRLGGVEGPPHRTSKTRGKGRKAWEWRAARRFAGAMLSGDAESWFRQGPHCGLPRPIGASRAFPAGPENQIALQLAHGLRVCVPCAQRPAAQMPRLLASTKCREYCNASPTTKHGPQHPSLRQPSGPVHGVFDGPPVAGFCTASGHAGPPGFLGPRLHGIGLGPRLHGIGLDSRFARRDRSTMSLATQPSPARDETKVRAPAKRAGSKTCDRGRIGRPEMYARKESWLALVGDKALECALARMLKLRPQA
ncbi:hypothetical protein B0T26DRAFT_676916 [Lasiosphaeria miniovina]|uniref:Uncharacterized protein n=1 Tax=Lasiosphaeria miniovina TaxID=1954250 RepID=A0AA40AAV0_9PEZI|nr:uncharacterized protein B0T26DRAFT_676916 [Lasiosphaeria miniovina]KAK0712457.1 hypothetical protein B0T26DRAFT_676916 [Lasiosphaeria miniovina]